MARDKTLTNNQKIVATRKLAIASSRFNELSAKERYVFLLDKYSLLFKDRITDRNFKFGLRSITEISIAEEFYWQGFPDSVMTEIFTKEIAFLTKINTKKTFPDFILSLLVVNFSEVLEGRRAFRGVKRDSREWVAYFKALAELGSQFTSKDSEKEFLKSPSLNEVEAVLKNPLYDIDLRKLIYLSQKVRLKKKFIDYCFEGLNSKPYNLFSRDKDYKTIFQFLFLVEHFKIHVDLNKKSPYPPKRVTLLESIQEYRGGKDSENKIFGQIQKIFDPDYGQIH